MLSFLIQGAARRRRQAWALEGSRYSKWDHWPVSSSDPIGMLVQGWLNRPFKGLSRALDSASSAVKFCCYCNSLWRANLYA